jgi:XapX domain-containing protein
MAGAFVKKSLAGVLLGLFIDAGCRWLDIPVPSPPPLLSALLVVVMSIDSACTGIFFAERAAARNTRYPPRGVV